MLIPILIGVVVLSVILLTHELGHFIMAKSTGVKVEEFGLGFPPRLVSFKWGETRYSLNAIPFGGFNRLSGEEDPEKPRTLASKSRTTRLLVLSAGSVMNFLLALMLFSAGYLFPREATVGQVLVVEVAPNSPAALAGIETGDIVLSVNNQPVRNSNELHQYVMENLGKKTTLLIQHDSTKRSIEVIPRLEPPEGEGAVGIATSTVKRYPLWQVIPLGATELIETTIIWGKGLASMFTGGVSASFLGPLGIAQLAGEVAKLGIVSLLRISALISLVLGIMNLFPLPAADGGHVVFVLLEWVRRGRRIAPKTETLVHLIGFALLMIFFLAITYQDIMRLISGESLIP